MPHFVPSPFDMADQQEGPTFMPRAQQLAQSSLMMGSRVVRLVVPMDESLDSVDSPLAANSSGSILRSLLTSHARQSGQTSLPYPNQAGHRPTTARSPAATATSSMPHSLVSWPPVWQSLPSGQQHNISEQQQQVQDRARHQHMQVQQAQERRGQAQHSSEHQQQVHGHSPSASLAWSEDLVALAMRPTRTGNMMTSGDGTGRRPAAARNAVIWSDEDDMTYADLPPLLPNDADGFPGGPVQHPQPSVSNAWDSWSSPAPADGQVRPGVSGSRQQTMAAPVALPAGGDAAASEESRARAYQSVLQSIDQIEASTAVPVAHAAPATSLRQSPRSSGRVSPGVHRLSSRCTAPHSCSCSGCSTATRNSGSVVRPHGGRRQRLALFEEATAAPSSASRSRRLDDAGSRAVGTSAASSAWGGTTSLPREVSKDLLSFSDEDGLPPLCSDSDSEADLRASRAATARRHATRLQSRQPGTQCRPQQHTTAHMSGNVFAEPSTDAAAVTAASAASSLRRTAWMSSASSAAVAGPSSVRDAALAVPTTPAPARAAVPAPVTFNFASVDQAAATLAAAGVVPMSAPLVTLPMLASTQVLPTAAAAPSAMRASSQVASRVLRPPVCQTTTVRGCSSSSRTSGGGLVGDAHGALSVELCTRQLRQDERNERLASYWPYSGCDGAETVDADDRMPELMSDSGSGSSVDGESNEEAGEQSDSSTHSSISVGGSGRPSLVNPFAVPGAVHLARGLSAVVRAVLGGGSTNLSASASPAHDSDRRSAYTAAHATASTTTADGAVPRAARRPQSGSVCRGNASSTSSNHDAVAVVSSAAVTDTEEVIANDDGLDEPPPLELDSGSMPSLHGSVPGSEVDFLTSAAAAFRWLEDDRHLDSVPSVAGSCAAVSDDKPDSGGHGGAGSDNDSSDSMPSLAYSNSESDDGEGYAGTLPSLHHSDGDLSGDGYSADGEGSGDEYMPGLVASDSDSMPALHSSEEESQHDSYDRQRADLRSSHTIAQRRRGHSGTSLTAAAHALPPRRSSGGTSTSTCYEDADDGRGNDGQSLTVAQGSSVRVGQVMLGSAGSSGNADDSWTSRPAVAAHNVGGGSSGGDNRSRDNRQQAMEQAAMLVATWTSSASAVRQSQSHSEQQQSTSRGVRTTISSTDMLGMAPTGGDNAAATILDSFSSVVGRGGTTGRASGSVASALAALGQRGGVEGWSGGGGVGSAGSTIVVGLISLGGGGYGSSTGGGGEAYTPGLGEEGSADGSLAGVYTAAEIPAWAARFAPTERQRCESAPSHAAASRQAAHSAGPLGTSALLQGTLSVDVSSTATASSGSAHASTAHASRVHASHGSNGAPVDAIVGADLGGGTRSHPLVDVSDGWNSVWEDEDGSPVGNSAYHSPSSSTAVSPIRNATMLHAPAAFSPHAAAQAHQAVGHATTSTPADLAAGITSHASSASVAPQDSSLFQTISLEGLADAAQRYMDSVVSPAHDTAALSPSQRLVTSEQHDLQQQMLLQSLLDVMSVGGEDANELRQLLSLPSMPSPDALDIVTGDSRGTGSAFGSASGRLGGWGDAGGRHPFMGGLMLPGMPEAREEEASSDEEVEVHAAGLPHDDGEVAEAGVESAVEGARAEVEELQWMAEMCDGALESGQVAIVGSNRNAASGMLPAASSSSSHQQPALHAPPSASGPHATRRNAVFYPSGLPWEMREALQLTDTAADTATATASAPVFPSRLTSLHAVPLPRPGVPEGYYQELEQERARDLARRRLRALQALESPALASAPAAMHQPSAPAPASPAANSSRGILSSNERVSRAAVLLGHPGRGGREALATASATLNAATCASAVVGVSGHVQCVAAPLDSVPTHTARLLLRDAAFRKQLLSGLPGVQARSVSVKQALEQLLHQ